MFSIGDDEVFQLGQLMQRIFGEQNFIANVIWEKVCSPKNTAKRFSDDHDYIVVYAQNANSFSGDPTQGLAGDFVYLRCRRIAPGQLDAIDHGQVWTALQLIHMPTLEGFDEAKPLAIADHDDQRLIYVPHFRSKDGKALAKAVAHKPAVIVYTWQPESVKARLRDARNVEVKPVPESLARKFGIRI